MDEIVFVVGGLAALVAIIVALVKGVPHLRAYLAMMGADVGVLELLDKYVDYAIMAAFKAEEKAFESFDQWLAGTDKKQIASNVYDLLVGKYGDTDVGRYLMSFVSKEEFSEWVEMAYGRFRAFYIENQDHFAKEVEEILRPSIGPIEGR